MTPKSKYSTFSGYTSVNNTGGGAGMVGANSYGDINSIVSGNKSGNKSFGSTDYIALLGSVANLFANNESVLKPGEDAETAKKRAESEKIDQTGTQIASAIGPWWGALAQVGTSVSKDTKGEGGNYENNFWGQAQDPFNQFKGNEDVEDWTISFAAPGEALKMKAKREKEEYEKRISRATNQGIQENKQAGAFFQNSLQRYTAPMYGKKGMKIRTKYGS